MSLLFLEHNQNGVAECMNRTITEHARSMRSTKQFWAEAVNTVVYLINHGLLIPMNERLHKEAWSSNEISLSHIKVFVFSSYVHIDAVFSNKLDPNFIKYTFIGYESNEFGYKL